MNSHSEWTLWVETTTDSDPTVYGPSDWTLWVETTTDEDVLVDSGLYMLVNGDKVSIERRMLITN